MCGRAMGGLAVGHARLQLGRVDAEHHEPLLPALGVLLHLQSSALAGGEVLHSLWGEGKREGLLTGAADPLPGLACFVPVAWRLSHSASERRRAGATEFCCFYFCPPHRVERRRPAARLELRPAGPRGEAAVERHRV